MKFQWVKRKWTVVVMPDNHRTSFQLNISHLILYFIPLLFLALICVSFVLHGLNQQANQHNEQLHKQIASIEQGFSQTLTNKDNEIEQLREHVLVLSEQADEVQSKMSQLIELENEIIVMTDSDPELFQSDDRPVQIAAVSEENGSKGGSEPSGGPMIEVNNEEMDLLAKQTRARFFILNEQMTALTDDLSLAIDLVADYQETLRVTPSIWPTTSYRVTSNYGYRKDPFTYRTSFHGGIDIAGNYGDPIYAAADGVVLKAGYDRGKGNYVEINHGRGIRTVYMHLSKRSVLSGEQVSKGDTIGKLGSTGRSTGPHLHYEVLKNGSPINPAPYMKSS
jgi:murein DD-endopeptidase MepM/ murein hydrolase activator NlpD